MKAMLEVDEHHWWYRGRRDVIRAELDRLSLPACARVLDAGCGSGRTLDELQRYGEVPGIELDPEAAQAARARGDGEFGSAAWRSCRGRTDTFDLITCLDVIEHTPDDRATLAELRRVCKQGGWLLVTVPAYQWLWSLHDEANHHYRRYRRATLRAAALAAGWRVERMTSFNSLLLAPAAAVRLAQRRTQTAQRDTRRRFSSARPGSTPRSSGRCGSRPMASRGRTLPAGLSLLALMRKPAAARDER